MPTHTSSIKLTLTFMLIKFYSFGFWAVKTTLTLQYIMITWTICSLIYVIRHINSRFFFKKQLWNKNNYMLCQIIAKLDYSVMIIYAYYINTFFSKIIKYIELVLLTFQRARSNFFNRRRVKYVFPFIS